MVEMSQNEVSEWERYNSLLQAEEEPGCLERTKGSQKVLKEYMLL